MLHGEAHTHHVSCWLRPLHAALHTLATTPFHSPACVQRLSHHLGEAMRVAMGDVHQGNAREKEQLSLTLLSLLAGLLSEASVDADWLDAGEVHGFVQGRGRLVCSKGPPPGSGCALQRALNADRWRAPVRAWLSAAAAQLSPPSSSFSRPASLTSWMRSSLFKQVRWGALRQV
jgi:hypothetical protein